MQAGSLRQKRGAESKRNVYMGITIKYKGGKDGNYGIEC